MELTFKDAKFFKQCVDAVVNLVDEGSFEVSSEGLHLRSLDASQIALVDFKLPKTAAFSSFEVEGLRTVSLNLVDLSKILARSRPGEKLAMRLEDEERNKLHLEFVSESKRSFKLPLLDLRSAAMPREPKVQFGASVKMKAGVFQDMLKDAFLVSSHVQLQAKEDGFVLEAHGDAGDLKIESSPKHSKDLDIALKAIQDPKTGKELPAGPQQAMYPSEYLDKMCRAAPSTEPLSLEFTSSNPVRLSYKIGDAHFTYFLAPRVES